LNKIFARILLPAFILVGTYIWMIFHPELEEHKIAKTLTACWLLISGALILLTLSLLDSFLNRVLPWKKRTILRFFVHIFAGTIISITCLNLSYYLVKEFYTTAPPDMAQLIVANTYCVAVIFPLFSMFFGYQFLKDWRQSELETERLHKENARSQMMALKNHLDPHFLFNNLNILSSLMDKDTELSKTYLDKFAEVYRIILKTEQSDLSTVEDEIGMIESYVYLLKVRFGGSVKFEISIDNNDLSKAIPPLAIQMLIENAIKHNMANEANPILIKVYSDNNHIIVENNLQKKKYATQERKGSGLQNIKNRYEFFSDKQMEILETEDTFKVILPLLEIEYD